MRKTEKEFMPTASPIYYDPCSGIKGAVQLGDPETLNNLLSYPAAFWKWRALASHPSLSTVCSGLFPDALPGFKTCEMTAGGVVRIFFNPFANPDALLNTFKSINCVLVDGTLLYAQAKSALIIDWDYEDNADGTANWMLRAVANWQFSDFFNDLA